MAPYRSYEDDYQENENDYSFASLSKTLSGLFSSSSSDRVDPYEYYESGPKTNTFVPLVVLTGTSLGNKYYLGNGWKTSLTQGGINAGISYLSHQLLYMDKIQDMIGNGMLVESGINSIGSYLLNGNSKNEYYSNLDKWHDAGLMGISSLLGLYMENMWY